MSNKTDEQIKETFQSDFNLLDQALKNKDNKELTLQLEQKRLTDGKKTGLFAEEIEKDQERFDKETERFDSETNIPSLLKDPVMTSNGRQLIAKAPFIKQMARVESAYRIVFVNNNAYLASIPIPFIKKLGVRKAFVLYTLFIQYGEEEAIRKVEDIAYVHVSKEFWGSILGSVPGRQLKALQQDGYIDILNHNDEDLVYVDIDAVVKMFTESLKDLKKLN